MKNNHTNLNNIVIENFIKVNYRLLVFPFFILLLCYVYFAFYNKGGNYVDEYISSQKSLFLYINSKLSKFPNLALNITHLGDALILCSFISVFIIYAPKVWEALLTSAIISLITSAILKKLFAIPRPAAVFNHDDFLILGKTLSGKTSLPSGHSIAAFTVITILLLAFMPNNNSYKIAWSTFMVIVGLIIAFSRVAVGAHYPFDVITGSAIGYIATVIGIRLNNKIKWLSWFKNKKYNKLLILILLIAWILIIVVKIVDINLFIFNLSLISLIITLYLMSKYYYVSIQKKS